MMDAYRRVTASGTGEFVFCTGQPGSGRTTVLAQFISELSWVRGRPVIFAGGFNPDGTGRLHAWSLGDARLDLLKSAGSAATGLGQLAATASAAAAVAGPTGGGALVTSLTGLLGSAAEAGGFAALVAASSVRGAPQRFPSASDLFHSVSSASQTGRPVVLVLDDVDQSATPVEWCTLLMERWLGPLMARVPLLVVASLVDDDKSTQGPIAEGLARGLARAPRVGGATATTVALTRLTASDIETWLELVDAEVVADLLSCAGGHPGWTVALFQQWATEGIVARGGADGTWRYGSGGRKTAAESAEAYVSTLLWNRLGPDVAAYDRAQRILRLAATEGVEFTADVVATILGEDREELIDWVDAYLVDDESDTGAPLIDLGFLRGSRGPLVRYAFRSPLLWAALHPSAARTSSRVPPSGEQHASSVAYARALAEAYGTSAHAPSERIARLYREGGEAYAALHHQHRADLNADNSVHQAVLEAELAALQERGEDTPLTPAEGLHTATRIIFACVGLGTAMHPGPLIKLLRFGYNLAAQVEASAPQLDTAVLQAHVLMALSRIAYAQEWFGDAVAFSEVARSLWRNFPDEAEEIAAAIGSIGAYGRMLETLDAGIELLDGMVERQIPVEVPSPLPDGPASSWGSPVEVADLLTAAAQRLVPPTEAALAKLSGPRVGHLRGELCLARSDLSKGHNDLGRATALLREAADHFGTCVHGELCPRRGEAFARAVGTLFLLGSYDEGNKMARRALFALVAHSAWARIANVQSYIAHIQFRLGHRRRAAEAAAHGVYVARMAGVKPLEGFLWRVLFPYAAGMPGDRAIGLQCGALAVVLSDRRKADCMAALEERLGDASQLPRLIEQAEQAWETDQGADLLRRAAGVTFVDTQRYLALCAQGIGPPEADMPPA